MSGGNVILAKSAGFCYGVKRAVELAKKTALELDPTGEIFKKDRTEVMGYDMADTSLTKAEKKQIRKCFSYEVYKNTTKLETQLKCMVDLLEDATRLTGV